MRLKPAGKLMFLILAVGVAVGGYKLWQRYGGVLAPEKEIKTSEVPKKADLPDLTPTTTTSTTTEPVQLPGSEPGCTDKPEVRWLLWAWNSQMGAMFANGGPQATRGSLMCKHGVNLKMIRQDDVSKMQEGLVAFATELKRGSRHPENGAHFVAIMGDGAAAFLQSLNSTLRRLGPEYQAKVVGSCGFSRGEDKFMGPPAWKQNPQLARGGVVAGVLRDGDWNIAMKWLADNEIPNNPDEKTYDPNALNWVAANDYIDAGEKYITGWSESRPVVRNGRRTGQTKQITVNSVVTWTPGDVNVATKKGGLVSIVSTKEYSSQMPNTIIGIDRWMRQNPRIVEGMLQAIMEGGQAVKSNPDALRKAAAISAVVYKEQDADYWMKYYRLQTETDAQGLQVELGGSSVNTIADNMLLYGLVPGSANLFEATYRTFGDVVVDQYPELVPNYPAAGQILDTRYIRAVAQRMGSGAQGQVAQAVRQTRQTFASRPRGAAVLSRRAWKIPFHTGQANFSPAARQQLERLRRDLLVAGGAVVEVHGHTDAVGNPAANMNLSEQRAFAVKNWLEKTFPVNFPSGRVSVHAHGQTNPVAPNSSESGRARNRRVEIILKPVG